MKSILRNQLQFMERLPKISIVIPTYKRSQYLRGAIESSVKQTNKYKIPYEIIVVNNDPNDEMKELVDDFKGYNIAFYSNERNFGQVGNINQGIKLSKGEFVAVLHDDDLLLPWYLDCIYELLTSKYTIDFVLTSYYVLSDKKISSTKYRLINLFLGFRFLYRKNLQRIKNKDNYLSLRNIYSVPSCGFLMRKKAIEEYGFFRDIDGPAWDYYNYRVLQKSYNIYLLHQYVGVYRLYTGMSNNPKVLECFKEEELKMLDENKGGGKGIWDKLGRAMVKEEPFVIEKVAHLLSGVYYYSHNLDVSRAITKKIRERIGGSK